MPPRPHKAEWHSNGNREGLPPRLARGPYLDSPQVPFRLTQGHDHPRGIEKGVGYWLLERNITRKQDRASGYSPSPLLFDTGTGADLFSPKTSTTTKYLYLYILVLTHSPGCGETLFSSNGCWALTCSVRRVDVSVDVWTPGRKRKYVLAGWMTSHRLSTHNPPLFHVILLNHASARRAIADARKPQK